MYYGVMHYFNFLGKNTIFLCKHVKNWPSLYLIYLQAMVSLNGCFSKCYELNH